ncbi:MAG: sulfatase-like hydrolase/transferase [Planctomycetota bacterium]|nr:sulfatase-like hydrolase/transferase [Planctomycetota bacterium]
MLNAYSKLVDHLVVLFAVVVSVPLTAAADTRPNVIIVLCDDLGFGDLSCYGHPYIQTPNLDRLATDGIRFTNFYSAAPVCSPSRVGLLTGRSPNRAGVYDWIPESKPGGDAKSDARDLVHMQRHEVTLPQILQEAGYATCMAGKWHCNSVFNNAAQPQPGDAGFDHWMATQNNAAPSHENPRNFVRNGQPIGEATGFSCQVVVDEATAWLKRQTSGHPEQPFFMYLAFHEPHEPVASPSELVEKYLPVSVNAEQAQFFANVHNVDLAVGRLIEQLTQLNIHDNTLIVFSSDNGPETLLRYKSAGRSWGRAGILRGVKLHTHDGGYHVAGIMNWPAGIKNSHTDQNVASSLDLLPTVAELAGARLSENRSLDGISLVPLLKSGDMPERTKPLVWTYYNAINDARVAMRFGPWKVLARLNSGRFPRYENLTPQRLKEAQEAMLTDFEIYKVSEDPGESLNLAGRGLENENQLKQQLETEYRSLANDSFAWDRK